MRQLAAEPDLRDRVTVLPGYVPADRLAELLAGHDVLALTYRSATASQNALLGHAHGLPVLASDVGTFRQQVVDGVDGLVVPPNDEDALVAALRRLSEPAAAAPPAGQRAHPGPVQPVGPLPRRARGAGLARRRHRGPAEAEADDRRDGEAGGSGRPCRTGSWRRCAGRSPPGVPRSP